MVVAYSSAKGKPQGLSTVYQQTLTYIQENNLDGLNPRRLFELDFHAALRTWKSKGERLLVFMDVNEHVINGKFMRRLMEDSMLDLVEETHRHWEEEPAHTYINGKDPIDCGLRTKDVEITGFLMQPYSRSVGDHRTIILDATTLSMVGSYQHSIVSPPMLTSHHTKSGIQHTIHAAIGRADGRSPYGRTTRRVREKNDIIPRDRGVASRIRALGHADD